MIKVIGAYKIYPTIESIKTAARYHKFDWLLSARDEFVDKINWHDFRNLGLIEIQVFGEYTPGLLMKIEQNDQSPYLEFYLDASGTQAIEEEEAIKLDGRRVCFFLHFLDASKPLATWDQELRLPEPVLLPERLWQITHYVPVD